MALAQGTSMGSGTNFASQAFTGADNYEDVFGFDNAPTSTNLPKIYEREVTRYGDRTLMGFLRMIGAESPTNSQEIRWAEQKRLHIIYNRVTRTAADSDVFTVYTNDVTLGSSDSTALTDHSIRVGDKVLIGDADEDGTGANIASSHIGVVASKNATTGALTILSYVDEATTDDAGFPNLDHGATVPLTILVIGSEFGKASDSRSETIRPEYDSYTNNTIIMRDTFEVSGTDANQIGWVEIADENGVQGKYWYLKGKSETMSRIEDYAEIALIEDKKAASGSPAAAPTTSSLGATATFGARNGSEGLFSAIESRGNTTTGGFDSAAGTFRNDLDLILKQFDKEGNIEENVLYLNRSESLNFDDGMAAQSVASDVAWGMFNNSENMGLTLGFTGVRRGSYDFYKKDWKYLNQLDGRGSFNDVKGVSIPMGSTSVYNQYGQNLQTPYLEINYLAGGHSNRKMQTWAHGGQSAGRTNGKDAESIEFLTERCLKTCAANNFFLFK